MTTNQIEEEWEAIQRKLSTMTSGLQLVIGEAAKLHRDLNELWDQMAEQARRQAVEAREQEATGP